MAAEGSCRGGCSQSFAGHGCLHAVSCMGPFNKVACCGDAQCMNTRLEGNAASTGSHLPTTVELSHECREGWQMGSCRDWASAMATLLEARSACTKCSRWVSRVCALEHEDCSFCPPVCSSPRGERERNRRLSKVLPWSVHSCATTCNTPSWIMSAHRSACASVNVEGAHPSPAAFLPRIPQSLPNPI